MKFAIAAIAIVGTVVAKESDFPGNDWFHADCSFHVTYPDTKCSELKSRIYNVASSYTPGPAKGKYAVIEEGDDYVWFTRTTPTAHYVDDIMFKVSEDKENTEDCIVYGKSRSQTLSFYDYDTNYCNMWNVFNGVGYFRDIQLDSCWFHPDDSKKTCAKY